MAVPVAPFDPSGPINTYRITAMPQSGNGFATTSVAGIDVATDTTVTITLATPLTLNGQLTDGVGAGVPFQFLEFLPDRCQRRDRSGHR